MPNQQSGRQKSAPKGEGKPSKTPFFKWMLHSIKVPGFCKKENPFSSVMKNVDDLVLILDKDGNSIEMSDSCARQLGYSKKEILGKSPLSFVHPKDIPLAISFFESSFAHSPRQRHVDLRVRKKDGEYLWVEFSLSLVSGSSGQADRAILVGRDVTEYKRHKESLQQQIVEKDQFLEVLSHDLKNALAGAMGFLELIKYDFPTEQKFDFAQAAFNIVEDAVKLLENFVLWSRLQLGRLAENPSVFDLSEKARNALDAFGAKAKIKGISLESRIPEKTFVFAKPYMVERILANLISNSLKFTNAGGKITLSSYAYGSKIAVSVEDSGVGMSKETLEKLFDPKSNIYEISRQGTSGEMGTGTGMALVKEMVLKNGGSIWVESQEGVGTKVTFTLPSAEKEDG